MEGKGRGRDEEGGRGEGGRRGRKETDLVLVV